MPCQACNRAWEPRFLPHCQLLCVLSQLDPGPGEGSRWGSQVGSSERSEPVSDQKHSPGQEGEALGAVPSWGALAPLNLSPPPGNL